MDADGVGSPQQLAALFKQSNKAVARRRRKVSREYLFGEIEERLWIAEKVVHAEHGLHCNQYVCVEIDSFRNTRSIHNQFKRIAVEPQAAASWGSPL